jgi:methanogenic corrinoid protein MtbC1
MISKNIKVLRQKHHMNQKDLAKLLEVSQSSIAHYENGDRQPTIESLMKMASFFKTSVDELIGHKLEITSEPIDPPSFKKDLVHFLLERDEESFNDRIAYLFKTEKDLKVIEDIVSDVLKHVGFMWESGKIGVSDEHYYSAMFRSSIHRYSSDKHQERGKTGIALTSPNEQHTIGIELVTSLLKRQGIKLFYLGRNVPNQSLVDMIDELNPDFILFSITLSEHVNSLIMTIDYLLEIFKGKIIIGGQSANALKNIYRDKRVSIIEHTDDVYDIITT